MTMKIAELEYLLEVYGADAARWPSTRRADAEHLLAMDPAAVAALERARRLDALITKHMTLRPDAERAIDITAARIVSLLDARPLRRRRRYWLARWWPADLLNAEFSPAWPRIAALASVAALGFAVGFTDLAMITAQRAAPGMALAAGDPDLTTILFEPDPLSGVRP